MEEIRGDLKGGRRGRRIMCAVGKGGEDPDEGGAG